MRSIGNSVAGSVLLSAWLVMIAGSPAGASHIEGKVKKARDRVFPALVNIRPILELYRGGQKVKTGATVGSGVIFTKDGHALTNFHVAGHAAKVICTLGNKERISGKVIGGDSWTDLAVIQLDREEWDKYHPGKSIPYARLGDSDKLQVGEPVIVMGSPRGLARSVTMGIISNLDRYLGASSKLPTGERTGIFNTWIQTDAAINPGNSGGPLVNLGGQVVGINTRAFVRNTNNLGFAVPVNLVKRVVDEILKNGKVVRSSFGIRIQETRELEELLGADLRRGVLVVSVEPSGPAQRAGIRAGDLILQIDGEDVVARFAEELPAIYNRIARFPVASEHTVQIQRRGKVMELKLATEELTQIRGKESEASDWGLTIRDLTETQKRQLDVSKGVYVTGTRPGGPAARAKFSPGDVIQEVAGKPTPNVKAFKAVVAEVVANRKKQKVVGVRLYRGKGVYIKAVRLAD